MAATGRKETLSHRERVRLALNHQTTDRVPISLLCAGINEPARVALDAWLQRERRLSAAQYLDPLVDVKLVDVPYIGPPLAPRTDMWGVHRSPVSYGPGSYLEIDHYPLAAVETIDDLARHRWPTTEWFDYAALPERLAQMRAAGDLEQPE